MKAVHLFMFMLGVLASGVLVGNLPLVLGATFVICGMYLRSYWCWRRRVLARDGAR
jgi:hypothetical protein